jgi:hypothetical protein
MRDIYCGAKEVVVWLGEGNEHTDRAMDCLDYLASRAKVAEVTILDNGIGDNRDRLYRAWTNITCSFLNQHDSKARLAGVCNLFRAGWWSRAWTVQEIALARVATVHVGKKSLPWEYFKLFSKLSTLHAVHTANPGIFLLAAPLCVQADTLSKLRWRLQSGISIPLSLMVDYTRNHSATNPRDKIYAILGLVNCGAELVVDYNQSCQTVYAAAMRVMLQYFGDLRVYDFLGHNHVSRDKYLPS